KCRRCRSTRAFVEIIPAQPTLSGSSTLESADASAALGCRDVTGGDFAFVGGKGRQHFALLARRDLGEIEGPSEFRRDLIELCGRDPQIPVGLLEADSRR